MKFGKVITTESYYDGKLTNEQVAFSIPNVIKNKSEALNEIINAIDLITSKQTRAVSITIKADKDYQLKLLITEYVVDNIDTPET